MTDAEKIKIAEKLAHHMVDAAAVWSNEHLAELSESDPEVVMDINVMAAYAVHGGMIISRREQLAEKLSG